MRPHELPCQILKITHALKSEPPISKAERHVRLHNAVIDL
jgi:hypothetical protein